MSIVQRVGTITEPLRDVFTCMSVCVCKMVNPLITPHQMYQNKKSVWHGLVLSLQCIKHFQGGCHGFSIFLSDMFYHRHMGRQRKANMFPLDPGTRDYITHLFNMSCWFITSKYWYIMQCSPAFLAGL